MKKKYSIILTLILIVIQLSCQKGEFDPAEFAINLVYPEPNSKCEKGEEVANSIIIPFEWSPQGNIQTYTLILDEVEVSIDPENIEEKEGGNLVFKYPVEYNKDYTWQIKSNVAESDEDKFTTPLPDQEENQVPLAVNFEQPEIDGNTINFKWTGGDSDNNDSFLRYDAYIGDSSDVGISNNIDFDTNLTIGEVSFTIPNFDPNRDYFLLVVAKDGVNEAYSILKFSQF
ncbi:hypothetical protein [Maribacter flavus]|uniref:Uncharacterized protein n=1 Tax=Maribacter flavus TaxID=1658664 RepID=A0A5B2TXW3_9FLAO|nr:hypothetical protein [Maribacter flavus]KAA2219129.1 hypothetical protein F0361_05830 [Maribacter flavus]